MLTKNPYAASANANAKTRRDTADLPSEFDLSFDTGLTLRKCRVAWQTITNVGVSFEEPAAR